MKHAAALAALTLLAAGGGAHAFCAPAMSMQPDAVLKPFQEGRALKVRAELKFGRCLGRMRGRYLRHGSDGYR